MKNRLGEIKYNTFGSKMVITKYNNARDINVYFPEYDWTYENTFYDNFNKGQIKCPYEPRLFDRGYIGEGKYKGNKYNYIYRIWVNIFERCYHDQYGGIAYMGCEVCKEWYNFQNFAQWYEENYYEIEGERICVDKDILNKGNKVYSPNNCIIVPNCINVLFVKNKSTRGNLPIGVYLYRNGKKYKAQCNNGKGKQIPLGTFDTPHEAFYVYKDFKENLIKQIANQYRNQIPYKLYKAMHEYKVEIND